MTRLFFRMTNVAICLASSAAVMGCSCEMASQDQAFQQADAVFHAKVLRIQKIGRGVWDSEEQLVTFRLISSWKGQSGRTVTVFTLAHPKMCDGYHFSKALEYIIYASTKGAWRSSYAAHTKELVFEVGNLCPLRIITDVADEEKLLNQTYGARRRLSSVKPD